MGACPDCGSYSSCLLWCRELLQPRPNAAPPAPAKYESQGTWFAREEEQKRALRLQIAGRLKREGQGHALWDAHGMVAYQASADRWRARNSGPALDSFRTYPFSPKKENPTMAKATIDLGPGLTPLTINNVTRLTLTTTDGHEIGGVTAVLAYDWLVRERDEARAELAALKGKMIGVNRTLDYYRRHVPESQYAGTTTQTLFAAIESEVGGSAPAKAPAVTPETVVTLGMLGEIMAETARVSAIRRESIGLGPNPIGRPNYRNSPIEEAVVLKLGRK